MLNSAAKLLRLDRAILHRVLPFALFMAFIALEEMLRLGERHRLLTAPDQALLYLYPLKVLSVAALMLFFASCYRELRFKELLDAKGSAVACLTGLAVFFLWISMDLTVSVTGAHEGYNPQLLPQGPLRGALTAFRLAGAVLVVPVMEELFWRSFLLRYLVAPQFEKVPIGSFTWGSFLATTVLFGLEHHMILAGMAAGAVYSILCYQTRSLAQCVLAHAVTNLTLGCYVLYTGRWYFW